jgi:hypothetical protein
MFGLLLLYLLITHRLLLLCLLRLLFISRLLNLLLEPVRELGDLLPAF